MQDGEVETTQNEVLKEQEPTKKGLECEAICKTYQAVRYTCNWRFRRAGVKKKFKEIMAKKFPKFESSVKSRQNKLKENQDTS